MNIFLSHRHFDEPIARVLQEHLEAWLKGHGEVYRSSKPGSGRPGQDLENTLQSKIKQTDLFILIYTMADEDWSWCMYELGIAAGQDTKETTVVVFNCTDERPKVRVANLEVNARKASSILNFVNPFHNEPEWVIPDEDTRKKSEDLLKGLAFQGDASCETRADELQIALASVLPKSNRSTRERLDHFALQLEPGDVATIRALRSDARAAQKTDLEVYKSKRYEARQILLRNARVGKPSNAAAAARFGYDEFPADLQLEKLIDNWLSEFERRHESPPADKQSLWIDELLGELSRATEGTSSTAPQYYMRSVNEEDTSRKQPVVVRSIAQPDGGLQYIVNLFQIHRSNAKKTENT